MLIIRKEQMEVLSRYMVEQFVDRAAAHLRSSFIEQTKALTDDDIRALINSGIEKAEGFDLTIEEDVTRYLELMIIYGKDFDSDPGISWAGEILNAQDLSGAEKIERLDNYIKFNLEEEHGRKTG